MELEPLQVCPSDWREAQAKEKELIAQAKVGKLSPTKQGFARLSFKEAAEQFLQDRTPQLALLTVRTERERARSSATFTPALVLTHIRQRKADGISNATINRELDIIRGVLKKAKRWHLFADEIKPLPLRQKVGRALSYEEKLKLLKTAASRPEWQNAAWAANLALNTTMRSCEIKQLRWRDVDLMERTLVVGKSKTEAGERAIPLNNDAWNTILLLYDRAKKPAEVQPEHYVFPACEASNIDMTKPMTSWHTAWRNLTRQIPCPACGTKQQPAGACSNEKCGADIQKVKSPLSGFASTTCDTTRLRNWRSLRQATARLWRSLAMCRPKCSSTIPMSDYRRNGQRSMRFPRNNLEHSNWGMKRAVTTQTATQTWSADGADSASC